MKKKTSTENRERIFKDLTTTTKKNKKVNPSKTQKISQWKP
jgi:hypothetical protein